MIQEQQILDVLRSVYDPEIPIDVVDLGLIYKVDVTPEGDVGIRMTMTAPQCPMSGYLVQEVEESVRTIAGVKSVHVDLVFDPPWDPSMIKQDALKNLGLGTVAAADATEEECPPEK